MLAHHVANQLDGIGRARHHQQQIGTEGADLGHLDREILRLRVVGDGFDELERQVGSREHLVHRLPLRGSEIVVGVQERRGLRLRLGGGEQIPDQSQAVAEQHAAVGEIADQEFVALLGELRRRADVDHERHLTLLADLGDRQRGGRVERADDAVRALVDRALGLRARHVRIALDVDVDELDLVAVAGEHFWGKQRAAMTARPAGAR